MSTAKNNRFIQPYLFFNGSCEQAVEFYRKALGAEVQMMMRFKDSPEPPQPGMVPAGFENKIMHASYRVGQTTVMASDGCSAEGPSFQGFSLSLSVPSESEADRVFAAMDEFFAYHEMLQKKGHIIGGEGLQNTQNAATLRFRNGKMSVTDGPYAE